MFIGMNVKLLENEYKEIDERIAEEIQKMFTSETEDLREENKALVNYIVKICEKKAEELKALKEPKSANDFFGDEDDKIRFLKAEQHPFLSDQDLEENMDISENNVKIYNLLNPTLDVKTYHRNVSFEGYEYRKLLLRQVIILFDVSRFFIKTGKLPEKNPLETEQVINLASGNIDKMSELFRPRGGARLSSSAVSIAAGMLVTLAAAFLGGQQ
nr:hypothetical protein TetV2_00532 [Oceanusvirus sp.]